MFNVREAECVICCSTLLRFTSFIPRLLIHFNICCSCSNFHGFPRSLFLPLNPLLSLTLYHIWRKHLFALLNIDVLHIKKEIHAEHHHQQLLLPWGFLKRNREERFVSFFQCDLWENLCKVCLVDVSMTLIP